MLNLHQILINTMNNRKIFIFLAVKCLLLTVIHAQETNTVRTVSGIVTDNFGDPLPGASIVLKGTNTRTIAKIDGKYSLNVPENAILQFSFIGFDSQEIAVENSQEINVVLVEQEPAHTWIRPATPISLTEKQSQKAEADNSFAFKMFREVSRHNAFFSPFSLNMIFGMLYNGTSGDTRTEIIEALGMKDFTEVEINEYYQKISQTLLGVDPVTNMIIANSIWCNNKFPLKNSFIEIGKEYFDADVISHDFNNPNVASIIDNWCAEKTRGRINNIGISPTPNDMMYLINALYFKSEWREGNKFDKAQTKSRYFTKSNNRKKRVRMMEQTARFSYYADQYLQSVELPYGNGAFSMVVLLPPKNTKIDQLIKQLDDDKWQNIVDNMRGQKVQLRLPRFKFENEFFLKEPIMNLGMEQMFNGGFENITDFPMWVDDIKQKTFVEVNEEGTEAAAVTGMVVIGYGRGGKKVKPVRFFADRPFVFLIREKSTGAILFMGRVDEPNE